MSEHPTLTKLKKAFTPYIKTLDVVPLGQKYLHQMTVGNIIELGKVLKKASADCTPEEYGNAVLRFILRGSEEPSKGPALTESDVAQISALEKERIFQEFVNHSDHLFRESITETLPNKDGGTTLSIRQGDIIHPRQADESALQYFHRLSVLHEKEMTERFSHLRMTQSQSGIHKMMDSLRTQQSDLSSLHGFSRGLKSTMLPGLSSKVIDFAKQNPKELFQKELSAVGVLKNLDSSLGLLPKSYQMNDVLVSAPAVPDDALKDIMEQTRKHGLAKARREEAVATATIATSETLADLYEGMQSQIEATTAIGNYLRNTDIARADAQVERDQTEEGRHNLSLKWSRWNTVLAALTLAATISAIAISVYLAAKPVEVKVDLSSAIKQEERIKTLEAELLELKSKPPHDIGKKPRPH